MLLEGMEEAVPAGEPQRGQKCRQHCQEVSRQLHLQNTNRQAGGGKDRSNSQNH